MDTNLENGGISPISTEEIKNLAYDSIVNQKHSANWTINYLVEKDVNKDKATTIVNEIVEPIKQEKERKEDAKKNLYTGIVLLIVAPLILLVEFLFLDSVHIILFVLFVVGLILLIKGIVGLVQKG